MSVKNKNPKGYRRCKTVTFRVSPEEAFRLDMQVKTLGMFKQDFILKRLLDEKIEIRPNIRIQKNIMPDECTEGKISVEEYTQWMEDYFPNRKPKQDK